MTSIGPVHSTIGLAEAAKLRLDVLVIGAGPAGVSAALAARQRGLSVLIVDRAKLPRGKVCGCCLNRSALDALEQLGARHALDEFSPDTLGRLRLGSRGRVADVALDSGIAISRQAMDAALLRLAVERGVHFVGDTRASVSGPDVQLASLGDDQTIEKIRPGVTLAAGGLRSDATDRSLAASESRMGVGAVLPADDRFERGTVYMACAARGYVGVVRLEDGSLNVAGAFDSAAIRQAGGVGQAVQQVIHSAGLGELNDAEHAHWQGTPALTRRRQRVWRGGVLFVGDAAGYVEPLTGQGRAWAARGGLIAGRLVAQHRGVWSAGLGRAWQNAYNRNIKRSWLRCRVLSAAVRRPHLTELAVGLLGMFGTRPARPGVGLSQRTAGTIGLTRSTAS